MKKLLGIWILAGLAACAGNTAKKEKTPALVVSRFDWLNGKWKMTSPEGVITENWKPVNDSLMEGRSDFLKGDSVIPFETMRLYRSDTSFYYEAKAAGQNQEQPVAFRLTVYSDTGFTAENPSHDFPKRISYTRVTPDSIHAFVDGGPAQTAKREDFYYSRSKE